ncbi:Neuroligin-4, X-linked [Araneus ventricosus]|uniref:Neuroligin-4, X-linked n=1 Tax=Araneus ventricosus TaxID=182803 RepID=A0A4Y2H3K4_ARAVE|nr:Neuroligin-4, X-linked [Araneus ventricosus]
MTTTWSTTYVVEKCDVMWKLPHPVLTGGSERQLRKLTFGIDLSDYNVVGKQGLKVPVMVYIHGESYEWNAGNPYDGRVLASYGNVVVVTINFRLGILGFLPAVDRSARGNYGLLDQVAALHWIQENIGEFGGDAENVTIFGQGFGAAFVNLLMLSPMAKGLFHRAIMQSGSALSPWAIARDAIAHTLHLARVLDCPAQHNTALVECMRKRDLQEIMNVEIMTPDYLSAFGPTVDGIVIPQDPSEIMEKNSALFTQYDLLFGTTRVESYFQFSAYEEKFGMDSERRDRVLRTMVRNLFTYHLQEIFLTIVNEYMDWSRPFLHATDIFDGTIDAIGDALVVAPIIRVGSFHSGSPRDSYLYSSSSSSSREKKSFFYVFGYQSEYGDYSSRLGAVTGEDLAYVFGAPLVTSLSHFANNYTKAEGILSEILMLQWTNFAKFGDPNVSPPEGDGQSENLKGRYEKVTWPAYEPVHQKYLSISMKPRVRDHYHAHRLSYWLNLIPRLHSSGDVNVSVQHHRLQDHDNPLSYDGTVRHLPGGGVPFPSTLSPLTNGNANEHSLDHKNETKSDGNISLKTDSKETELISSRDEGNSTQSARGPQKFYSTALIITIAVGCTLLVLNVVIFAGIYYQKEKDSLEKKLQKNYYQEKRSDDEEGQPSSEKPFLVKDLSSSMMLNQYCSQQEFDGSQTLDLVQPSKVKQYQSQTLSSANSRESCDSQYHMSSRTPQSEKGISVREAQPLLTPPSSNPHTITATVDCLQGWPNAQEMSVYVLLSTLLQMKN